MLICASIILVVGPTVATSSKMLRSSASISVHLLPLKVGLTCITILSMILLWCISLIVILLKLTLTILRSLVSILWYKSSKLLGSTLTIVRSVASTLTWGIVIVIIRVFISISFICLLGFRSVMSLFLRFPFSVKCNLTMHCSVIPFIIQQPIQRPHLLERVYKPMCTSH